MVLPPDIIQQPDPIVCVTFYNKIKSIDRNFKPLQDLINLNSNSCLLFILTDNIRLVKRQQQQQQQGGFVDS